MSAQISPSGVTRWARRVDAIGRFLVGFAELLLEVDHPPQLRIAEPRRAR